MNNTSHSFQSFLIITISESMGAAVSGMQKAASVSFNKYVLCLVESPQSNGPHSIIINMLLVVLHRALSLVRCVRFLLTIQISI